MFLNSSYNNQSITSSTGFIVAVAALLVMAVMSFDYMTDIALESDYGICLKSVKDWQMPHFLSWSLNILSFGISALLVLWLNKEFRFIHDSTKLFATAFIFLSATNPWLTCSFSAQSLFTPLTLVATFVLFSQFGKRNATEGMFITFSTLSAGSIFQYSFALMIPIFLIATMYLNTLRIKEICAAILGIIAPYWIALGFGLIDFNDFRMPDLQTIFFADFINDISIWMLLNVALTSLLTLLLALSNSIKVFATNSQTRAYNSILNLFAFALFWYIIFDFVNMATYIPLLNLMAGILLAHFFVINPMRRGALFIATAVAVYVTLFCFTLYA